MQDKLIGLIRVSTGKQGESGLGLEAQEAAIEEHRRRCNGNLDKNISREIESGYSTTRSRIVLSSGPRSLMPGDRGQRWSLPRSIDWCDQPSSVPI